MKIETIELDNWMAFRGVQKVGPLPSGAIAVVARYLDNPRRSNWAGKTAFLEAVEWCLFGIHRKRYDDDLIFTGADTCGVRVTLSTGDQKILVMRKRNLGKSTKLEVRIAGEVLHKKAAQEKIVELLGFDSPDYRATVCFVQGDTDAMVKQTSGERRKTVAQWLELDPWLRVAARARARLKKLTAEITESRATLKSREELVADFDPEGCERDIHGSKEELENIAKELVSIEAQLEAAAASEIQRLDQDRLATVLEERAALRAKLTGQGVNATRSELETLRSDRATDEAEDMRLQKDVAAAQRLVGGNFDGQCPVTCSACPVPDQVTSAKDAAATRLKEARHKAREARERLNGTKRLLAQMEGQEKALGRLREQFNARTDEAKRLKAAIDERAAMLVEVSDDELQALKDRKRHLFNKRVESSTDLRSAERELENGRSAQEWIADVRVQVNDLEKEIRHAHLAVRATGAGGIPAAIAESSLSALEERANAILAGTGLSFDFAMDRATKKLVTSCMSCGYAFRGQKDKACPACDEVRPMKRANELEILVSDGSGAVEDVKAKSGGAKILVGAAIRLAAGMMLRDRRAARWAVACIDEPFGALDSENREALARSFAGMLGSVGLEQAFVISHDGSLLDALPGRIEIVRHGDYSVLELM